MAHVSLLPTDKSLRENRNGADGSRRFGYLGLLGLPADNSGRAAPTLASPPIAVAVSSPRRPIRKRWGSALLRSSGPAHLVNIPADPTVAAVETHIETQPDGGSRKGNGCQIDLRLAPTVAETPPPLAPVKAASPAIGLSLPAPTVFKLLLLLLNSRASSGASAQSPPLTLIFKFSPS